MRVAFPVLAAVFLLAACASEPRVVNATPPGVSYRFQGENVADATLRADRYCQQYGKRARLQAVNRTVTDNVAVYECL
jgi:uncharacterized lipoprotein YajG